LEHIHNLSPSDTDTVTLGPELVIEKQSIAVASQAQGFNDVDGILGYVWCIISQHHYFTNFDP
jgi:hypothetical protein